MCEFRNRTICILGSRYEIEYNYNNWGKPEMRFIFYEYLYYFSTYKEYFLIIIWYLNTRCFYASASFISSKK